MITIIMGVYNGAASLGEALDSIIAQTYTDWELIVCNDGSTDNTLNILNDYALHDERIKIISNTTNCGLAASLNRCLDAAKGDYIARMDCDDISVPERLEKQLHYLEENAECDLVGTYMQEFDSSGKHQVIAVKERPTKYDLPKMAPFSHATILVRTHVMKSLGGYHISKHTVRTEDVDLWYRFFAEGFTGINLPEVLYFVRVDRAAYHRRKLKYMLHASYIIWYGCDMLKLKPWYKIYCLKPIISWLLPPEVKAKMRKFLLSTRNINRLDTE